MGKILIVLSFTLLCNNVFSQNVNNKYKGSMILGVEGYFNSFKADGSNEKINNSRFSPSVGFFLANNLALGINLDINNASGMKAETAYGPYARIYISNTKTLFLKGSYSRSVISKVKGSTMTAGMGISLDLSESVALEPSFNYFIKDGDLGKGKGTIIAIGIQTYLRKKKNK